MVGGQAMDLEIARDEETRRRGFMFRRSIPDGQGMLFVFPETQALSFWMRNTYVPLDVAYAGEDGVIFQIERMTPLSEDPHPSEQPARYALESPAGWFARVGIRPGATIGLPESVRKPRKE